MDFETFVELLSSFLKQTDNLYLVLYAAATCVLTQIVKKLFVNKTKVEVLHKFDIAAILPFLFGIAFAVVDLVFVAHEPFGAEFVAKAFVTALTVGALATVIFKLVSALSGNSLKSLMKDDAFCVFYSQLLYFGEIRAKLADGEMTLADFVTQVKILAVGANEIYTGSAAEEEKKQQLYALLAQNVSTAVAESCTEFLHRQLFSAICGGDGDTEQDGDTAE